MKIIHINKSDIRHARSTYRLHRGLREIGVDSKMLVDNKLGDDADVYRPDGRISKAWSVVRPLINQIPLKFYDWEKTPFYIAWIGRDIVAHDLAKQSDIIHLHWLGGGLMSIRGISRLIRLGKPIVWTLHDMWAFTGGCHYSRECEKYVDSCGACPQLGSSKNNDITRRIWKGKRRAYRNLKLTIASPSRWLAECAKKSSLFSSLDIKVIPNGLDIAMFKPIDKSAARKILNLPENKKTILFGAAWGLEEAKGFKYLREAISELERMKVFDRDKQCLVIFGTSYAKGIEEIPFEVKFLGRLSDDFSLALSYSAADVFVIPSLGDNLPSTIMESFSCGTPVVGFNVGGIPEMIEHQTNGYLSEYKSSKSLAEGIKWILEDENRALKLGDAARRKAIQEYSLETEAERYKSLYRSLLERKGEVEYHGSKK